MSIRDFLLRKAWKRRGVKLARGSRLDDSTQIGFGTHINGPITVKGRGTCTIGRYCAIGADVKIITSNHLIDYPNLQCSLQRRIGSQELDRAQGPVHIGNNVWIGDSVLVLTGVTIGDGAVIGAGAVVARDVPDFGVAVGVPARIRRMRFAPSTCLQMATIAWWDWDEDRIRRNRRFFDLDLASLDGGENLQQWIVD